MPSRVDGSPIRSARAPADSSGSAFSADRSGQCHCGREGRRRIPEPAPGSGLRGDPGDAGSRRPAPSRPRKGAQGRRGYRGSRPWLCRTIVYRVVWNAGDPGVGGSSFIRLRRWLWHGAAGNAIGVPPVRERRRFASTSRPDRRGRRRIGSIRSQARKGSRAPAGVRS